MLRLVAEEVPIPIQRLHHPNVVVHDLQATARSYARLLGITRWAVRYYTPQRLSNTQLHGYQADFGYTTATGANARGVRFRLIQPTHGFSTFTEHLLTRGEGIHSLCATSIAASSKDAYVATLPEAGLTIAQAATLDNGPTSLLVDTRQQLGGFCMEVVTDKPEPATADERWDFAAEVQRPPAVEWLAALPRIGHFGIAVSSLMDHLPHYARLLGVERWSGVHFHHVPGSLESSTVRGQPVDNAWLIALTDVADFGLELLQGTRAPTDYQQTIARSGEGIHHMLVRRDLSEVDWWALRAWMESLHIGTVMSGRVRWGAAEFFYLDTRAVLGYLLEVIVTRQVDVPQGPTDPLGRFALDFSRRAA